MTMDRRVLLGALATLLAPTAIDLSRASAQDGEQWFALSDDTGRPVPNLRLPVELTSEVEVLPGAIWIGSDRRDYTIVEFFDYNCPFCRRAAADIHALAEATPALRVGLVNNPILSRGSVDAARIEMAVLQSRGPKAAYAFHGRLYERRGTIDHAKAVEVAGGMGLSPAEIEAGKEPETQRLLDQQISLAASLGFAATPSFLVGGAGILGYPGPRSLGRMVRSLDECAEVVCP
jgi:protein-disulfide isomerase